MNNSISQLFKIARSGIAHTVVRQLGVLKTDDHESLRMWASENDFGDPESLIDRKDGKLLFKSARAAKQYRRLEAMYKDRRTQNA